MITLAIAFVLGGIVGFVAGFIVTKNSPKTTAAVVAEANKVESAVVSGVKSVEAAITGSKL